MSDSDSLSEPYFENEKIKISTSNLSGNLDVIFYKNNQDLQKYFLQGVQSGFFYINANKKRNAKVNFIDFSKTEILGCEIFQSNTKKIIFVEDKLFKIIKKCELTNTKNIVLINSSQKKINAKLNIINPYQSYLDYLMSLDLNILPKETILITDKKIKSTMSYQITGKNNIEKDISNLFEINKSSNRKKDLERITQRKIYQTPRFRNDIRNIIVDTENIKIKRIIPAFEFNLIFEPQLYVLPRQLDFWKNEERKKLNIRGLEHPVLFKKSEIFNEEFSRLNINEKIFFSLGFDSLLLMGKGINYRFQGMMGTYLKKDNKIFIQPEKIGL